MKNNILFTFVIISLFMSCKSPNNTNEVGLIVFKTGGAATYGEKSLNGINLALDKIKDNSLHLIIEDDQTKPEKAVSAYNKITSTHPNIQIIIGALTSSSLLAIAPLAEKDKVILFSPCSSSPEITNAGDYIFRNWPSDEVEGKLMASFAKNKGINKVVILAMNNAYGIGLKDVFTSKFSSLGGKIIHTESFNENTTDFKSLVNKLKNVDYDAIYAPSHAKEAGLLIKTLRENGVNKLVMGCVTYESPDLITSAGNSLNNVVFTTPWFDAKTNNPASVNFVKSYKQKYNEIPDNFAAQSFDAIMILKMAIDSVGYNSDNIKDYLYSLKNYNGVSGLTSFDINGDVIKPALIKTIKNNKFVVVDEVN